MSAIDGRRLPVSALFLIVFDKKVGYTLSWHRALEGVSLDGVEFQSLPSGLHGVQEDLVYFVNGEHAGVSAFVQEEADGEHRNAAFVSVGVLLPLSEGRLGRGWLLGPSLRKLARQVVSNPSKTGPLERFWDKARISEAEGQDYTAGSSHARQDSIAQELQHRSKGRRRSQFSTGLTDESYLPPDHPSMSVPGLLDLFGPLIFPIYRNALVRKRILLLGAAPVQQNCNAAYILSVLASLPLDTLDAPLTDRIPPVRDTMAHIKPLFNVGVHDIPTLSQSNVNNGWIACTTDDILRDKTQLYDLVVQLPASSEDGKKRWPRLYTSEGEQIRATQRDLRRYKLLRLELRRMRLELRRYNTSESSSHAQTPAAQDSEDESEAFLNRTTSIHPVYNSADEAAAAEVVEPVTWTEMVYNGFMWWSAGSEMAALEQAEHEADHSLLDELPDIDVSGPVDEDVEEDDEERAQSHKAQATATIVVAYFLHLTAQILRTMSDLVEDSAGDSAEAVVADGAVCVNAEDMTKMGLDTWSAADKVFVQDAMTAYFQRDAVIEGEQITICGVRLC